MQLLRAATLFYRPAFPRTALVAVVAASIALSSQPQITLFVYIVAAIIIAVIAAFEFRVIVWKKFLPLLLAAGVVGIGLASFSILPLMEFLPETERADALPISELFEFSYPPYHAITLLLPYFYGDHEQYWGAKGFQELAAFVGLIPLVLAIGALSYWKTRKPERFIGVALIVIAVVFGLGRYSPIYRFLVENHYVTSLGVASRFVFFFDIGIVFLAAISLDDIIGAVQKRSSIVRPIATGLVGSFLLLIPFLRTLVHGSREYDQLRTLVYQGNFLFYLVAATGIALLLLPFFARQKKIANQLPIALVIVTGITLLAYAWNYNPPVSAKIAFNESPIATVLREYKQKAGLPARLYARPELIQKNTTAPQNVRYTDAIGPSFSAYQPVHASADGTPCFQIPLEAKQEPAFGTLTVGLHTEPRHPALYTATIPHYQVGQGATQKVCFDTSFPGNEPLWLSFSSASPTNIVIGMHPQQDQGKQAYLVRIQNPTQLQWEQSQKPFSLNIQTVETLAIDEEAAHLARHLNVIADASSARWIGALSIREYRNFIEFFFANDSNPIDGDGKHAIERYRSIVNLAGITHLAQLLPADAEDGMEDAGYTLEGVYPIGSKQLRLYTNPQAFSKTFMVPNAIWKPAADETRDAMRKPEFDPKQLVYLSGPKPVEDDIAQTDASGVSLQSTTRITTYTSTRVDVETQSNRLAYLLLTDSTTPDWQTYIDGKPAAQLVGDSIFKAAAVPAGKHVVSFRYESPAVTKSIHYTIISLIALIAMASAPYIRRLVVRK